MVMNLIRKRLNWRPSGANNEEIQFGALRAPIIRRFNLAPFGRQKSWDTAKYTEKKKRGEKNKYEVIAVGENMSLGEDWEREKKNV